MMKFLMLTVMSLPVLAMVIDLILGDPERLPHPVRAIGRFLDWLEPRARAWKLNLRFSGMLCVVLTAGLSFLIVFALSEIYLVGMLVAVYFAYAGLALGQLQDEGRDALDLIMDGELEEARVAVGMLVSRDTSQMDEVALRRTLAETVSENLNDGFFAPLFYLIVGGPAVMWAYKAVSTMDSMWGYRTDRFRDLGWAAAKADDLLAYIPARLTAFFLIGAGAMLHMPWRQARDHVRADARKMESPNAGWPMAACAWLVQGSMGGPATYFGVAKCKPNLGPQNQEWTLEKLKRLFRLTVFAAFLGIFVMQFIRGAVGLFL